MNPEKQLQLAGAAITHVLLRIHESPEVGYYMGYATESFARLCEAHGALHNQTIESVQKRFEPSRARDPRRDLTKRIDELEEALDTVNVATGCGIEEVATYGPQNLTPLDFMEQVKTLLTTHSHEPARFVAEISALFDVDQVPYHCIAR